MTKATRGERNCNPGNIEREPGIEWLGMMTVPSADQRFCVFYTMLDGVRALAKLLLGYQRRHQLSTVREIINRWAPPGENNTSAYVIDVANRIGHQPDTDLDLEDPLVLAALARAIVWHENGRVTPAVDAVVDEAVRMALA